MRLCTSRSACVFFGYFTSVANIGGMEPICIESCVFASFSFLFFLRGYMYFYSQK